MPESPKPSEEKSGWAQQLGNYAQLAVVFPAATVIGFLIGTALDRWLNTHWIDIAGLILGIVAGFVELVRAATKDIRNP
jgi:F0F1-type ATP synthase assembly protein I